MQRARNQLLAGARLAMNQHRAVHLRERQHEFAHALDGTGLARMRCSMARLWIFPAMRR